MAKKTQSYKVLIPCRNGRTKTKYVPGQVVTKAELKVSTAVVANWLEIGVLGLADKNALSEKIEKEVKDGKG